MYTVAYWILDEHGNPIETDLHTWAEMFSRRDKSRIMARDKIDGVVVSTVFLGIDQRFEDSGPPILFETMIFGGKHDQYQDRYATKAEALVGHAKALELVKNG